MKIKKFLIHYSLFIILVTAAFLRLWRLGSVPPSLTSDEAALGYNAYSILKTGRDEYGQILPIIFKSFGDYKPGLYVYSDTPFVAVLGLNEFSTRLPSALAGVIAVWLIYKIVVKFSAEQKDHRLGLIAAFLLAVTPWHIHFSRGAWEVNLALTLTLAGIYFFLKSLEETKYIIHSSVFFTLTLITYQGAKLSSFIVIFLLLITYRKEFWNRFRKQSRVLIISLSVGIAISLPVFLSFTGGQTGRLNVFSVFSYPRKQVDVSEILSQGGESKNSISYYLFHSETLNFARGIMGRWFNHFSAHFLFFEGDWQNPRHSAPNTGMLLISDALFLTLGFVALSKNIRKKWILFIFLWLLSAPLPSILSRDSVHAVRAYNMVIPLTIVSSLGLVYIFNLIKRLTGSIKYIYVFSLTLIFLGSFVYYLDSYFVHLPKHNSEVWNYGYKQLVATIIPIENRYQVIKVQQSFAQPYIYFLFYQKYDPAKYQKQAKLVSSEYAGDVGYVERLDNIFFTPIDWPQNKEEHGILVAADEVKIPNNEINSGGDFNLIKQIKYLDGNVAFNVVETL